MTTTFELHEHELDAKFLRSVKSLFRNQRLRVVIEAETEEDDDWLTPALKEKLTRSLEEVSRGEVEVDD